MSERPKLDKNLDGKTFRKFYYLKERTCRFLSPIRFTDIGGKLEITERIAHFLDTGEVIAAKKVQKKSQIIGNITTDTEIEPNFVCSEKHRAFFKEHIGNGFSFNVAFQKWLKSNTGKTYADAITAYYRILEEKKNSKTKIDKQFEYNTYIRDFFADNRDKSLDEAIKCRKYKKQLPGHNRYEKSDLDVLEKE